MNGSRVQSSPPPAATARGRLVVEVDTRRCCGAGHCARLLPEVFEQDDLDGTSIVVQLHPVAALAPRLHEVATVCPTSAITLTVRG
jgi:ferredoxin